MDTRTKHSAGAETANPGSGLELVNITIDGQGREIHKGKQPVSEIKRVGGVPQAFELSELVDGKLTELDDAATVRIKGGEVFVSSPRNSSSS